MKKMTGKNTLMLFLTAFIWGTAFVAQSVGMDYIGPFTFTCVRSLIGGIFLIPCICFLDKWRAKNDGAERQKKTDRKEEKKNVILGGICCGLALCVASNLQQIGIQYTTVGKAGFITALYIVLVPIFGIFLKKKAGVRIWWQFLSQACICCVLPISWYLQKETFWYCYVRLYLPSTFW